MSQYDLQKAKALLDEGQYTCVLCCGDTIHTATARGVKPLMQWLHSGQDFTGFCAADKVVGKATAYLYVLLGAQAVYSRVISSSALAVFQSSGIRAEYTALVPYIINRKGDGICPFEEAVLAIDNSRDALSAIQNKMNALGIPY